MATKVISFEADVLRTFGLYAYRPSFEGCVPSKQSTLN